LKSQVVLRLWRQRDAQHAHHRLPARLAVDGDHDVRSRCQRADLSAGVCGNTPGRVRAGRSLGAIMIVVILAVVLFVQGRKPDEDEPDAGEPS
jgi:hypothetical protein